MSVRRAWLCLLLSATTPLAAAAPVTTRPALGLLGELPAEWRDDRGRALRLDSLYGQRVILTMAYATCHRICPVTMRNLEQLQRELDARHSAATFVVVGYDPDADDPQAWHQFRTRRHLLRDNWLFLSGRSNQQVRTLATRLGFDFWKYDEHVIHEGRVVVLDAQGQLQSSFGPGAALDAEAIAHGRNVTDSRGS
jgi:cytochrome oxidase Cu insertion factor (SCO1/SenC/PrrC family)